MTRFPRFALALAVAAFAAASSANPPSSGKDRSGEPVSAQEAEAMVKKGVAYIKANPRAKAMADITDRNGPFVDRELYLNVYDMNGTSLAHGGNAKFVGKNMMDLLDTTGRPIVRERLEMAKTKSTFWQDYNFVNPVNRKIEPKRMYCEVAADLVVCGGIYKPAT